MTEPVPASPGGSAAGFAPGTAGVTPPTEAGRHGVFLTDVIVELGFASKERIDEAEEAARSSGKTVEWILLDGGAIDENQLSLAIAERHGLEHVDLDQFEIDMEAAETIARAVASRCGAVPIARSADGALIVAVQDPFDSLSARRIETATEAEIRMVIAAAGAIRRLIERLPAEVPQTSSGDGEVPRMKSQRELLMDTEAETEDEDEPASAEDRISVEGGARPEPERAEPEFEPAEPEPEIEPERAEPESAARELRQAESESIDHGGEATQAPAGGVNPGGDVVAAAAAAAAAQAGAADPEEVTKPKDSDPEVERPDGLEPKSKPASDSAGFTDVFTMDLGPTSMSGDAADPPPAEADSPTGAASADGKAEAKRERELIETRGRVAELERRLEELVLAAEEATAIEEKLKALRRAVDESGN